MAGETESHTLLRKGATFFQIEGALCLIGAVLCCAVWLGTGHWPPLFDNEELPIPPELGAATVGLLGVLYVYGGIRLRRGSVLAALGLCLLSGIVFMGALTHLLIYGRGWFELLLLGVLGGFISVMSVLVAEDASRQAVDEDSQENSQVSSNG